MKKPQHGPSQYYASDRSIFDALNQSKVDADTIQKLFERRNIVCSKRTPRSDLSRYFSRLTHDQIDHQDISRRLGISARRERITSVDLQAELTKDQITCAIEGLAATLKIGGDVVQISIDGGTTSLLVQYSEIDYKRSEFSQVQQRDGHIELVKSGDQYVLRNTQSEYMNAVRDELVKHLENESEKPITRTVVSFFEIQSPSVRSKFFYDLMSELPGYVRRDVTDVFVYKARAEATDEDDEASKESHIERILMRGNGVMQSKLLNDLLTEKRYHISKVGWVATELQGKGYGFDIEAAFNDPKDCTGFSYLLRGVHELDDSGKLNKARRSPLPGEVDVISRAIENKARELMAKISAAQAESNLKPAKSS
ncbi:MAG: hypothetical protein WBK51_17215 [Polaromonas sp.]